MHVINSLFAVVTRRKSREVVCVESRRTGGFVRTWRSSEPPGPGVRPVALAGAAPLPVLPAAQCNITLLFEASSKHRVRETFVWGMRPREDQDESQSVLQHREQAHGGTCRMPCTARTTRTDDSSAQFIACGFISAAGDTHCTWLLRGT